MTIPIACLWQAIKCINTDIDRHLMTVYCFHSLQDPGLYVQSVRQKPDAYNRCKSETVNSSDSLAPCSGLSTFHYLQLCGH
jgi:hypothetical protein